jgi:small-conductance mechanosensitive channel
VKTLDQNLKAFFGGTDLGTMTKAAIVIAITIVLARLAAAGAGRLLLRATPQHQMLGRRTAFYAVLALGLIAALRQLGFDLSTLLGAAGIVTVALGFAAQTSASNFIAGLFLIGERPFVIGDVVRIGQTTGEVLSIDLLSIKLRTLDNLFVRVPNETVVKSEVYNLTHFPIRRVVIQLGVSYGADLAVVRRTLLEVADANPLCLDEPEPLLAVRGFGASSIDLELGIWCARQNLLEVQASMHEQIKLALERARIEIPYPQVRITAPGETVKVAIVPGTEQKGS